MDSERARETSARLWGDPIRGWLGVTSTLLQLAQNHRMHAPYQRHDDDDDDDGETTG